MPCTIGSFPRPSTESGASPSVYFWRGVIETHSVLPSLTTSIPAGPPPLVRMANRFGRWTAIAIVVFMVIAPIFWVRSTSTAKLLTFL